MDSDPQALDTYESTYFDYLSVDSGLISNKFKMIETINIMTIDKQETDSEILKYMQVTQDQVLFSKSGIPHFQVLQLHSAAHAPFLR